jgi:nucleotide-binding universal stress UspA family protein
MYTRIVVPLDGSDLAEQALPDAEELAGAMHAPVHLVRVVDVSHIGSAYTMMGDTDQLMGLFDEEIASASDYLKGMEERLSQRGLGITTELRKGAIVSELLGSALPGDVIVMTTHGRTGLTRFFMGSVAEGLLRHASVPVLLMKSTPGEEIVAPSE